MRKIFHNLRDRLFGRKTKIDCWAVRRGDYYSLFIINGETVINGKCVEQYRAYIGLILCKWFPEIEQGEIIRLTIKTGSKPIMRDSK